MQNLSPEQRAVLLLHDVLDAAYRRGARHLGLIP